MPKKYRNKKIISQASSATSSTAQAAQANPVTPKGTVYKVAAVKTGMDYMAIEEKYVKRDVLFSLLVAACVFAFMVILYFIFR